MVVMIATVAAARTARYHREHRKERLFSTCSGSTNRRESSEARLRLGRKAVSVCRAAKDERISRLQDFFESDAVESSVFDRNQVTAQGAGQESALASPAVRGALARDQTGSDFNSMIQAEVARVDGKKESSENARDLRPLGSSGSSGSLKMTKAPVGLRLADPKETALRTLQSYETRLRERLHRVPNLSASLPSSGSLPIPMAVRGIAHDSKLRAAVAFGVAALLVAARGIAMLRKRREVAEMNRKELAIRARRGERQRERFRQLFAGEDGVDASVFSAVRKKGDNAVVKEATDDANAEWMSDLSEHDDELEDVDAAMDEKIKKAYKDFVKDSKLGEGEFWDINDEVEAFEEIEIDFDD